MKRPVMKALSFAMAIGSAALPSTASAGIFVYTASLSGANESPPNASAGTGFVRVTWDDVLKTMRVQATFSGLTGTTTASHIHCCTATPGSGTAGVATTTPNFVGFPLGVTSGSMDQTYDMTLASSWNAAYITANGNSIPTATAALFTGMADGKAYYNIHTSFAPGGEIRGFLTAVPEPSTVALMAVGMLALVPLARRRRSNA